MPTNYTMIQYNNHHANPQLVDRNELRFYENEMLKSSYPQPIISTYYTLDAESNAFAPEAMKIDSRIPDLFIINESHTGPIESNIASFRAQEKGSEVLPIIYSDITKIPFTISDQFSRTIPDNINLTEPLQNFYQLYSNDSFTNFPKYQDDSQYFRKTGKDVQQRRQRSPYVTKACTNCRQRHTKCSGETICKYCMLRNLECIFIDSGKKRGPRTKYRLRTDSRLFEENYIFNGSEINFDEISMSFVTSNIIQSYALTSSDNSDITSQSDSYGKF
ncbi:hypothetical protein C2G38_2038951 [Gigaspora rosea]|uniref:Zn(2)-C6 fungal-type domain-containing protein n=1 Tax=Gigaspora rosea TaxID=44941 RepID=A0A397V4X1_9GLOM|nr:hypothetical protein C2G38_2038951 [Gigaspora rosea]